MSMLKTRFRRCAQRINARRSPGVCSCSVSLWLLPLPRFAGVTRARCLLLGANTLEADEIDPWPGHQGHQPGNKIQRLEDYVGGAIPIWRLEPIADVSVRGERQPLLGYHRAADVPAQAFELLAFIGPGRHPSVQAEAGHLANPVPE